MKKVSRQYISQQKNIKKGKCRTCSAKRNRSKEFCDECLKLSNARKKYRYHNDKKFRDKIIKRNFLYKKKTI